MDVSMSDRNMVGISPIRGLWTDECIIDPITGLMSFPSFFDTFPNILPSLLKEYRTIGLAIGDVDNLKTYVEGMNTDNPWMFGHLAGNAFMTKLGELSLSWFRETDFPWSCVSTFGGDEIILVCAGSSQLEFLKSVGDLSQKFSMNLPRSVSFAVGWFSVSQSISQLNINEDEKRLLCVSAISLVDRALFNGKHQRNKNTNQISPFISALEPRWLRQKEWTL